MLKLFIILISFALHCTLGASDTETLTIESTDFLIDQNIEQSEFKDKVENPIKKRGSKNLSNNFKNGFALNPLTLIYPNNFFSADFAFTDFSSGIELVISHFEAKDDVFLNQSALSFSESRVVSTGLHFKKYFTNHTISGHFFNISVRTVIATDFYGDPSNEETGSLKQMGIGIGRKYFFDENWYWGWNFTIYFYEFENTGLNKPFDLDFFKFGYAF